MSREFLKKNIDFFTSCMAKNVKKCPKWPKIQ